MLVGDTGKAKQVSRKPPTRLSPWLAGGCSGEDSIGRRREPRFLLGATLLTSQTWVPVPRIAKLHKGAASSASSQSASLPPPTARDVSSKRAGGLTRARQSNNLACTQKNPLFVAGCRWIASWTARYLHSTVSATMELESSHLERLEYICVAGPGSSQPCVRFTHRSTWSSLQGDAKQHFERAIGWPDQEPELEQKGVLRRTIGAPSAPSVFTGTIDSLKERLTPE